MGKVNILYILPSLYFQIYYMFPRIKTRNRLNYKPKTFTPIQYQNLPNRGTAEGEFGYPPLKFV